MTLSSTYHWVKPFMLLQALRENELRRMLESWVSELEPAQYISDGRFLGIGLDVPLGVKSQPTIETCPMYRALEAGLLGEILRDRQSITEAR